MQPRAVLSLGLDKHCNCKVPTWPWGGQSLLSFHVSNSKKCCRGRQGKLGSVYWREKTFHTCACSINPNTDPWFRGVEGVVGTVPATTFVWKYRKDLSTLQSITKLTIFSSAIFTHSWVRETTKAKLMDYTNRKNHLSQTCMLVLVSCGFDEKHYFSLPEKRQWQNLGEQPSFKPMRLNNKWQGTWRENWAEAGALLIWQNHACCLLRDTNLLAHTVDGSRRKTSFLQGCR